MSFRDDSRITREDNLERRPDYKLCTRDLTKRKHNIGSPFPQETAVRISIREEDCLVAAIALKLLYRK